MLFVVQLVLSLTVGPARPLKGVASPTVRMSATPFAAALLFDCDGVLVETEELHRTAYNEAFAAFGLEIGGEQVVWTVEYYDKLQNTVGGGKPKMKYHVRRERLESPSLPPCRRPRQRSNIKLEVEGLSVRIPLATVHADDGRVAGGDQARHGQAGKRGGRRGAHR